MNIKINGEAISTHQKSLVKIIENQIEKNTPFAIAINEHFVPKSNYENTVISEGDCIEILSPMQGG